MKHLCKSHSRTCSPRPGVDLGCRNFDLVSPLGGQVETGHFRACGQWPSATGKVFIWAPLHRYSLLLCLPWCEEDRAQCPQCVSSFFLKSPVWSLSDYGFSDSHQPALNCKWEVFVSAEWLVPRGGFISSVSLFMELSGDRNSPQTLPIMLGLALSDEGASQVGSCVFLCLNSPFPLPCDFHIYNLMLCTFEIAF